ncbi:MAG: ribbon-helix-helix protein, CopG family [Anaerolineae bacterium]
MYRTQILLRPEQHRILSEIAAQEKRSLSEIIREMIDKQVAARQQRALAAAAQALLVDYQTDAELTAFQALDGDDFDA